MCGISGIIPLNNRKSLNFISILKGINKRLECRGPDSQNIWKNDSNDICLGHTRLSIIDPVERSNQPFISEDKNFVITYNGELYNYLDQKKELEKKGHIFKTNSDTEVILKLYIEYNEKFLEFLDGMFAFCIYDKRNNETIIVRDRFGIKPLYYTLFNDIFIFSSSVKSIYENFDFTNDFSKGAVIGFLVNGSIPEPLTLRKNIQSVQAGTIIKIKNNSVVKKKYFSFVEMINNVENSKRNNFTQEDFDYNFKKTIKKHLISDVKTALFLSSGIDSNAILSTTKKLGHKIDTISLGFDEYKNSKKDELLKIKLILKNYDSQNIIQYVDKEKFYNLKQEILNKMDQPSIDGINTFLIANLAKEKKYKVALSGLGGDEIFQGYKTYDHISIMQKINKLNIFLKPNLYKRLTKFPFSLIGKEKYSYILNYSNNIRDSYILQRCVHVPEQIYALLPHKFVSEGIDEFNSIYIDSNELNNINQQNFKITYLEINNYLKNQLLRDSDWAGMANSVEIRVPFIDYDFIEFSLRFLNSTNNFSKDLLLSTIDSDSRKYFNINKKLGFEIPIKSWINSSDNYKSWSKEILKANGFEL